MPLKHFTETVLIVVLACVTILAGVLVSVLPPLPGGLLPWAGLAVLTLAYPLALYGFLRRFRADYAFRVLHFAPFFLALLWLAFQLVVQRVPALRSVAGLLTWGHGLVAVLAVLALIAAFCLHVIRRRVPRLSALGFLAAAFVAFVVLSSRLGWGSDLRTLVARLSLDAPITGSGQLAVNDDRNVSPSSDAAEEEWRQKIREQQRRASSAGRSSSVQSGASSSRRVLAVAASSAPARPPVTRLPSAGFGAEGLIPLFLAGYTGVLHRRAKRRIHS